jgi:REP element-mobilizing transposase RayT
MNPPREFSDDHTPLGYLITFRAYGTWLHGDERGSVDRFHRTYGTPMLPPSIQRANYERRLRRQQPVHLDSRKRASIESGILETCTIRNWHLWALNIRTKHVHTVVSADCRPERILSALKANATRSMREAGCWTSDRSPWVHRGSKGHLWTEEQLNDAIEYVKYDQGEPLQNPER